MEALGNILFLVSAIVLIISSIWFLIVAFQNSVFWGLLCLFIPFASIVFAILNWDEAGRPVTYQILSTIGAVIGFLMMGQTPGS